jgi:hypothetical protein
MSLRETIFADIDRVFMNTSEFAEDVTVKIGGMEIEAKIVRDDDLLQERADAAAQGIHLSDRLIFIKASLLPGRPIPGTGNSGTRVEIDGKPYFVKSCIENFGMYDITIGANKT